MSLNFKFTEKGPEITYEERTCVANPAGENSFFMSTACVKSVPLYNFKLT